MPRRRLLTDAQRANLLALPTREVALIRHYTLAEEDLALVATRKPPETKLGLALQLCALRYPGRLLRLGEMIPAEPLAFLAERVGVPPESLAGFARRGPTRYEQLAFLYRTHGFQELTRPHRAALAAWLLPIARETTAGLPLVEALLGEMRRRRVVVPGISVVERLAAAVLHDAEREVWSTITGQLNDTRTRRLDVLLEEREHERQSRFSWLREPVGAAAMNAILDRLDAVRRIGLDRAVIAGISAPRLRQLVREGSRLTAQGLRQMTPPRRRAILAATILELEVDLTDAALDALGASLSRALAVARRKREAEILDSASACDAAIRKLAALGDALLEARAAGGKLEDAVQRAVGWDQLGSTVTRAKGLFRDDPNDRVALLMAEQASVRRLGPRLLASFRFHGVPACKPLLDAIDLLRDAKGRGRSMPDDAPTAFMSASWRRHARRGDGSLDRRAYELCALGELSDRLRAGDVWVEGSRSYQAIDGLLIPRAALADLDAQGAAALAVPVEADAWIGAHRQLLDRELRTTARRLARAPAPDSQRLIRALLGPSPEKKAEEASMAARLDAMLPPVRLTDMLEEVDRWTGFIALFGHVQTGRPPSDRRAFLAALIAEATNLGFARMARVCTAASRKQLVWTATWHMREEIFALALARLVEAQDKAPLAVVFGAGTTSSSDGQHFFLGGPGEASGTVNPHRGREPSVSLYTHVNDRYAPFHVKVIAATAGEAAQVLDGLLGTAVGRRVQIHHVVVGASAITCSGFAPCSATTSSRASPISTTAASTPLNRALATTDWRRCSASGSTPA